MNKTQDKWQKIVETRHVNIHRTGWLGVLDALKAAVTGDKRLVVNVPLTLSLYIMLFEKSNYIAGTKLEVDYK